MQGLDAGAWGHGSGQGPHGLGDGVGRQRAPDPTWIFYIQVTADLLKEQGNSAKRFWKEERDMGRGPIRCKVSKMTTECSVDREAHEEAVGRPQQMCSSVDKDKGAGKHADLKTEPCCWVPAAPASKGPPAPELPFRVLTAVWTVCPCHWTVGPPSAAPLLG